MANVDFDVIALTMILNDVDINIKFYIVLTWRDIPFYLLLSKTASLARVYPEYTSIQISVWTLTDDAYLK